MWDGSSPLARGLRLRPGPRQEPGGIIPARAGFTPPTPGTGHGRSGSSPLARGLQPAGHTHAQGPRIIPARAGFTDAPARSARAAGDHPRSRGVYHPSGPGGSQPAGSSPLARGLRFVFACFVRTFGIIPARAGFTPRRVGDGGGAPDHPRSRGVYGPIHQPASRSVGSSPLARGLHFEEDVGVAGQGIIPARAGFTRGGPSPTRPGRDHPRSRGVYSGL